MMLRLLAAAFVVLVSQTPAAKAPDVDFSGRWSLVGDARVGIFGTSVTLTQTATTLTIERPDRSVESYRLNGETHTALPPPGDQLTKNPETTLWSYATKKVSISGWAANQLVIVTHQFNRVNSPGAAPREFDAEWTSQLKLSLDDDGRLVVERDMIMDPLPQPIPVRLDALEKLPVFPKRSEYLRVK